MQIAGICVVNGGKGVQGVEITIYAAGTVILNQCVVKFPKVMELCFELKEVENRWYGDTQASKNPHSFYFLLLERDFPGQGTNGNKMYG